MLHIERKTGEVICVDDDMRIIVTYAAGGSVRLSFEAPSNVRIYREEVYLRRAAEQSGSVSPGEEGAACPAIA